MLLPLTTAQAREEIMLSHLKKNNDQKSGGKYDVSS